MRELTKQSRQGRNIECPKRSEDWKTIVVAGQEIHFNIDTLRAVVLDNGEELTINPKSTKPQFFLASVASASFIVLNVTHGCNSKCKYCMAADYEKMPIMSSQLAREAVDRLFGIRTNMRISFFGGEPLMAWSTIKDTMEYARSIARARKVRCKFHITTNGTLLTPEMVQYLKPRNCTILISLDGPKYIHNEWRPLKNGLDAFDGTMGAIEMLHKHGMSSQVTLRGSFTPDCTKLLERLKFAYDLQLKGLCTGFSIEPINVTESCIQRDIKTVKFPGTLKDEYHAAAEWFVELVESGKPAPEFFHFRKLLRRLYRREVSGTECGAGRGYLTIAPDGTIYACHREEGTKIGHLRLGLDEELRCKWYDNRIYQRTQCMKCWARYACGGGCRQVLAEKGLPFDAVDYEHCRNMKIMIRECLWILATLSDKAKERYFNDACRRS